MSDQVPSQLPPVAASHGSWDMMNATPITLHVPSPGVMPVPSLGKAPGKMPGAVVELTHAKRTGAPALRLVLTLLFSVAAGFAAAGLFWVFEAFASIWGSSSPSFWLPVTMGLVVAGVGIAIAVWEYHTRHNVPRLVVGETMASVRLPGRARELMFTRDNVRLVTIDDEPVQLFHNNKRFPISGVIPQAAFADSLDRRSVLNPWDPGEPTNPVPRDPALRVVRPEPDTQPHTQPDEPGWAAAASLPIGEMLGRPGHLYTADGSTLPVFLSTAREIPNVAILFECAVKLPRTSMGRGPFVRFDPRATRAKTALGIMVHAKHAAQVAAAFSAWGVVRQPTADDVLGKGLRPPKALVGWRIVIAVVIALVPLVLRMLGSSHDRFPIP